MNRTSTSLGTCSGAQRAPGICSITQARKSSQWATDRERSDLVPFSQLQS
eukprot:CAMPEP_0177491018 /NCGR_PEP_ID=MMETSP0369-20130122/31589_1 /TAXON_ID=447022 ORGANISM="Scrippsiella hangoei-like, Strain SHHI-4" /NCGR_SAMPLE_ID=MMETSP0369 /ASSEMBLY_ACC=CAM_ASM_000364 /LENGTH=49 /DNA_ID= /DNA_START= /DNA_END= /DNA_ORIENTATION=